VLSFSNNSAVSRTELSYAGPKIKYQIFMPSTLSISVQHTILIPLAKDLQGVNDGGLFLANDAYVTINQLFIDKMLSSKLQLFTSFEIWTRLDRKFRTSNSNVTSPLKAILNYFPSSKFTTYVMTEFTPTYGQNPLIQGYYFQLGPGVKYQITQKLEIEALYTNFALGKSQGAGETFNLGLRLLR
jgi:hypothetical protein